MTNILGTVRSAALPLLLLTSSGCAGLGSWEDILGDLGGGLYGSEVSGEIRQVDSRRQMIELESGWGDRERVRYDRRTEVRYQQRRYDVRDLERGDRVRIRLDDGRDRDRDPVASVIYVERSANDRSRSSDDRYQRVQRLDGRIRAIDTRQGWFELEVNRSLVLVQLGYDPPRNVRDRFTRLRRGDRVRIEARMYDSRTELLRFL